MGCDGGTIPRRDELVRTKKKPEQKDKNAETVAKWKHCAISQEPLRKPIVACEMGRLYNKETVLEHILSKGKSTTSSNASHITKLADVKELNLTEKAGFVPKKGHKGDEYVDFNDSRYICPVTGLDMNGRQRFYLVWKCGCVLSERAINEVKSETCHKCGKPYDKNDVIIINGSDEEMNDLKEKMTERRRLAKQEKKKKRAAAATETSSDEKKIKLEEISQPSTSGSKQEKFKNVDSSMGTNPKVLNGDTKTSKIKLEESQPSTSGRKQEKIKNGDSSMEKDPQVLNGSMKTNKGSSKNASLPEKAQNSYSIAKDPNASAAYKSLFTSHKSAQKQDKAHWITHNPLYY